MVHTTSTAKSIFLDALELSAAKERQALLAERCGSDDELRREVEELLCHQSAMNDFLEAPPTAVLGAADTVPVFPVERGTLNFLSPSNKPNSLGRLAHYEILATIGSGGFGVVLKAFDEKLHRVVALKVLAESLAASETARQRFVREARSAASVRHDNVVHIYAVEETGPRPYLVMEHVEGHSLEHELAQRRQLELPEIIRIGQQLAAGLHAAHQQGLVHRDVKPANILLPVGCVERSATHLSATHHSPSTTPSSVKITDFGLARAADDSSLTQDGMIAGTPQYMSPEQARGLPVDPRSDLFSLGSVLYAMCTGASPFRAAGAIAVIHRLCHEAHRPIRELNPKIPNWLSSLIDRLLAKDPSHRIQSAQEVVGLLNAEVGSQRSEISLDIPGPRSPIVVNPKSQIPNLKFLALAAAFLFAAFSIWVIIRDKDSNEIARTKVPAGGSITVETDAQPKTPPTNANSAALAAEQEAFVVLGGQGVAARKFDALADAVLAASDGDTIEIRGNGPFVCQPVTANCALTIRAAAGFRPVIRLSPESAPNRYLIAAHSRLVLEGVELWGTRLKAAKDTDWTAVLYSEAPLHVANCRIGPNGSNRTIKAFSPRFTLSNCELLASGPDGLCFVARDSSEFHIDNCLLTWEVIQLDCANASRDVRVRVSRTTSLSGVNGIAVEARTSPALSEMDLGAAVMALGVSQTLIQWHAPVLDFVPLAPDPKSFAAEKTANFLRRIVRWRGEHNAYPIAHDFLTVNREYSPHIAVKQMDEWRQFWGSSEDGCVRATVKFQGGDLLGKAATAPDKLTPDDFRLRPDSAGYRAGPNGKDLGADIDLVGPGPAYERFKKTPAYEKWLEGTRPVK